MLIKTLFLTSLMIAFALAGYPQPRPNQWKGLVPLVSTRSDVERLLGNPINKSLDIYETTAERVTIWYSKGNCEDPGAIWNVPRDTATQILVAPKTFLSLQEIRKMVLTPLSKEIDPHVRGNTLYYTEDRSIKFETRMLPDGSEDVIFVAYSPGKSDEALRCKCLGQAARKPE